MGILAFLLGLFFAGCSSLLVHQDDPAPVVVGKIAWRSILGITTLGLSEVRMSDLREAVNEEILARERLQDYESHLTYLVNNGLLTQREAEGLYLDYAELVWQDAIDRSTAAGWADPYWTGYPGFYASALSSPLLSSSSLLVRSPGAPQIYSRSLNRFQRLSAIAKTRVYGSRWIRYSSGSRASFHRGLGGRSGGHRGGRR